MKMAKIKTVLCLMVATYLVLTGQLHGQDIAPGQRLLASKEFKLTVKTGKWSIEEYYSNEQGRARISISSNEGHKVYFHESARRDQFVEHDTDPKAEVKCKPIDANTYLDTLLGFKLPADKSGKESQSRGSDWLRDTGSGLPDHVVGFARLALWLDINRKRFEPREEANHRVRNVPVRGYNLKGDLDGCPIPTDQIEVYYPSETSAQVDWFGLPLSVYIKRRDGGWIWVEFLNAGPLREDMEEMNSRLPLDLFAYPVGVECSRQLVPAEWKNIRSDRLSFHMELLDYGDKQRLAPQSISRQFIAYDSQFELMRVDSMTFYSYTIAILDPRSKSRFNIFQETLVREIEKDARGNSRSGSLFDRTSGQTQCVRSLLNMYAGDCFNPFLHFQKLIPIGRAKIRGVDCVAFEMETYDLPTTLFHPIYYSNKDGSSRTDYFIDSGGGRYYLVYYFVKDPVDATKTMAAFNNQTLGALMRVDVYQNGELRYHLDISEFTFGRLVDAPNGDKVAELFALRDRCNSGKYGSLNYAKMNVELTLKIPDQAKINAKELASVLSSSSLRNQATLRTLAKSAQLLMTNVYDIETQLKPIDNDKELKIVMNAKLTQSDVAYSWPRIIGYAKLTEEASRVSFATSSSECLVYASTFKPGDSTVFANCLNRCAVFTRPGIEYAEDGKTIVSFSKEHFESIAADRVSDSHCPLLAIETSPAPSFGEGELSWLSNWVHKGLRNSELYMRLPALEAKDIDRIGVFGIPVVATHVDINNDHWSTSVGRLGGVSELSAVERDSVEGVGLTLVSGHRYSNLNDTDGQELPMDQAQCHSICASEPQCRSFSICLTSKGVECIISEVDFRDASLLKAIESERAKLTSRTEKKRVSVGNQVELRLDPRCKLHKQNALDMFHKDLSVYMDLRNYPVLSVDSLEKCAEVCWQNNQQFLAQMDKVAEELIGTGKESEAITKELREEYDRHKVDWCPQFYYLNLAYSTDLDWAKQFTNGTELDKAGLCVPIRPAIDRGPLASYPGGKDWKQIPVFRKYEFSYSSLYSAQYGKRLFGKFKTLVTRHTSDINQMRQRKYYTHDVEYCAKACFLQTEDLLPQCKSFDYVESKYQDDDEKTLYCILHTETLEDLRSSGRGSLIQDLAEEPETKLDPNSITQVWHYEPKLHAMSSAMIARRKLSRVESSKPSFGSFRVHGFGIFLVLLASIACTALIVKLRGEAIVDWLSSPDRRASRSSIGASLNPLD